MKISKSTHSQTLRSVKLAVPKVVLPLRLSHRNWVLLPLTVRHSKSVLLPLNHRAPKVLSLSRTPILGFGISWCFLFRFSISDLSGFWWFMSFQWMHVYYSVWLFGKLNFFNWLSIWLGFISVKSVNIWITLIFNLVCWGFIWFVCGFCLICLCILFHGIFTDLFWVCFNFLIVFSFVGL